MKLFFCGKKGITLIEVVIAATLVFIAVISIGALVTQSSVFSRRIDTIYTASYLAQRRIDLLKRLDFSQISSAVESEVRISNDGNIDPNGDYTRTTEITTDFEGDSHLIQVKVTVKRLQINMDGSYLDPDTGEAVFAGQPVVMETLFSDVT
ncbi:MAG: hypothetical protein ABIH09_02185 [Candidatus Omnitrophota bacterium]